jgi:hypothetical protein
LASDEDHYFLTTAPSFLADTHVTGAPSAKIWVTDIEDNEGKSASQCWEERSPTNTIFGGSRWRRREGGEGVAAAERTRAGRRAARRDLAGGAELKGLDLKF